MGNLLFQDSAGNTPVVISGEPVGLVIDKSGNAINAAQTVSAARPTYNDTPDRLTLDKVDDAIVIQIPAGGWIGSMVLATDEGTASYGINIPAGAYTLGGQFFPGNSINNVLIREGTVSASALAAVEQVFVTGGAKASYGDVTDFTNYWRDRPEITNFPLIDTSSGVDFSRAWNGGSLASFPLIDTSNSTTLFAAWSSNPFTSFPLIDTSSVHTFSYAWANTELTSFPLLDTSSGTNFSFAWIGNSLTSFPLIDTSSSLNLSSAWKDNDLTSFPLLVTSNVTNFSACWQENALTSFPLIDTSSGLNFSGAWADNNLTSFPLIDTSSGINFSFAWINNNLTSFPLIDVSSGTNFGQSWRNNDLTSFPLLNVSNSTNFSFCWLDNPNLVTFPANFFDGCSATNFNFCFNNTNLSEASIDGILVSINTNGTNNGTFQQTGGAVPSATGEAAITSLRGRGWNIDVTGGF